MKIWITTIGYEKYACANNIWLASKLDNFTPDKVIVLYNKVASTFTNKKSNLDEIKSLFPEIKIEEVEFQESIEHYRDVFKGVVESNSGNEVAIDITAGRRYMSIIATDFAVRNKIKRAYYTYFKDSSIYSNKPIRQIPLPKVELINFMKNESKKE